MDGCGDMKAQCMSLPILQSQYIPSIYLCLVTCRSLVWSAAAAFITKRGIVTCFGLEQLDFFRRVKGGKSQISDKNDKQIPHKPADLT
jgi:hypothetical protein